MAEDKRILSELGDRLYIQTHLKNEGKEGFSLTVLDGENVWEGTIPEGYLDQQCEDLKMDFNTYVEQTRAAFTQECMADMNFECQFKATTVASAQLAWKKMPTHDIKYNLGSVSLKKCINPARKICDVLSYSITNSRALLAEIQSLQSDNERLSLERQNALKRLDKCVTAKEDLEKDLYSKFIQVLNSKKERVRLLQDNAEAESVDDPATSREGNNLPTLHRRAAKSATAKHKFHCASENNDDIDEEEDKSSNKNSPSQKQSVETCTPHKVKKLESSLNLGEDDEEKQMKAPVARRPHRQVVAKKQTPMRPTLPRVSSGNTTERPGSSGRRSSLRKSGSNNSNKSDNLDPEDLLDNF